MRAARLALAVEDWTNRSRADQAAFANWNGETFETGCPAR